MNENQVKKQANAFGKVLDDLSYDDDWITKREKHDSSLNFYLLSVVDSVTREKKWWTRIKWWRRNF